MRRNDLFYGEVVILLPRVRLDGALVHLNERASYCLRGSLYGISPLIQTIQ